MNFSLIGSGFIMARHADAIHAIGGRIIDVVNTSRGEDTWREVVKSSEVDCIVILTPNDLHFDMAMASADAGKVVLCEKPLVIRSEDAAILARRASVFSVLQIRHHDYAQKLKRDINNKEYYKIEMDISVHRDPFYYKTWKGQAKRSGGVLFNLGIHYFDLLLYLFGEPETIVTTFLDDKTGKGVLRGKNYECNWRVSTDEPRETQRRVFRINGVDYNFSSKDNLSFENLHEFVYRDLLRGEGVLPDEALHSIRLIEKLYANVQ